jgi:ribosomal protein S18 acetylase RimI-like enzyme
MATIKNKSYVINYHSENGVVILDMIEVDEKLRGKGIAKKAMERFLNMHKGKTIELHAYPQDDSTDLQRLVDLYTSFGFEIQCGSEGIGYEMSLKN